MQCTTDTIRYIHTDSGFHLLNYVNDFIRTELRSHIYDSHAAFLRLTDNIGAVRSECKSIPPTQVIEFVGNLFNTIDLTIGVTPECKIKILNELQKWQCKSACTRNQLESLIGKLQFMGNCVRAGRLFIS